MHSTLHTCCVGLFVPRNHGSGLCFEQSTSLHDTFVPSCLFEKIIDQQKKIYKNEDTNHKKRNLLPKRYSTKKREYEVVKNYV